MFKTLLWSVGATCVFLWATADVARTAAPDIVLTASDATHAHGHWARAADATAARGTRLGTPDEGWAGTAAPDVDPTHYVEWTFAPAANVPYRVWLRLRAAGDSKFNDSVYVQFSGAQDAAGAPLYRVGTSDALLVNLQQCTGCTKGWGWADGAWWLTQASTVTFARDGSQTLRIQTREDGVQIDQIVLSPDRYRSWAPGPELADELRRAGPVTSTPHTGTPLAVPGLIPVEAFDEGPEAIAYHDTSAGNRGETARATNVDLQPSTDGGHNLGWIAPGEWLNYTVDVAAAGTYILEARVSSPGLGGLFHVDFDGRNATGPLRIPETGGWQHWRSVFREIELAAGRQTMKVVFDRRGDRSMGNLASIRLTRKAPAPYGGVPAPVPGTLRPEAFDTGDEGVSYHDTTHGNSGGQFRATRVDIENSVPHGHNVGWIADGEWLEYSIGVAAAGHYALDLEVGSPRDGGRLHARAGAATTPAIDIPNTGAWKAWTTVTAPIRLEAGVQILRLVFDVGGFNVAAIHLRPLEGEPAPAPEPPPATDPAPTPAPPPPPGPRTWRVEAGGNLQAALDGAAPGDTILLEAGATYVGNFVLPEKPDAGGKFVTLRSSAADALLPDAGTRITPAAAPYLPKLRSPNNRPALATAPRAHHYRLLFLEFLANHQGAGDILALGSGGADQDSLHLVPYELEVDRVYIHGDVMQGQKRGIALNSAATRVLNSHVSEIKAVGQDSQAIGGWNGPGPYVISNNYLEAAGENVMFGGADPAIPDLVPSDITFTRNHLSKPLDWRGDRWTVKNLFELKNARRVLIDGNLLENHWQAAQAGYAVLLKSVNQDGSAPWSVVEDVTFTNNVVRRVSSAINILGRDTTHPSVEASRIVIRNNLFVDVSGARYGGVGRFLLINGGVDITVDHNTVLSDGSTTIFADGRPSSGFVFTNNIVPNNAWALKGSGAGAGNATIARYFPNGRFLGGVFVAASPASYPAANFYPASQQDIGFVDPAAGNYRLSAASPYRASATDGADIGCNLDALYAALGRSIAW